MRTLSIHLRAFIISFCLLFSLNLDLNAKEIFVFQHEAWREYANGISAEVEEWLSVKGYEYMVYDKPWQPALGQLNWLYFRNQAFRIWFIVEPANQANAYHTFKEKMVRLSEVRKDRAYITFQQVSFDPGITILPVDVMYEISERVALKAANKDWKKEQSDAMEGLAKELIRAVSENPESDIAYFEQKIKETNDWNFEMELPSELGEKFSKIQQKLNLSEYSNGNKFQQSGNKQNTSSSSKNSSKEQKGSKNNTSSDKIGEGDKDGKSSKGGGGIGGKLPIKVKFSKWFQVVVRELLTYFQIRGLTEKALFVAYMIAPELIEGCADFFAKIQHLATIDELDDFLNAAADIYLKMDVYLKYLRKAYELLSSPDLQELVNSIDWKDIKLDEVLSTAKNAGFLPKDVEKVLTKIDKFLPVKDLNLNALAKIDANAVRGHLINGMKEFSIQEFDKRIGRKYGLDFRGLVQCAENGQNCERFAKSQMKNVVNRVMPKNVSIAFDELIEGDFEDAALKLAKHNLGKIPEFQNLNIDQLYQQLKKKDFENAIKTVGDSQLHHFGKYQSIAKGVLNGRIASQEGMQDAVTTLLTNLGQEDIARYLNIGMEYYEYAIENDVVEELKSKLHNLNFSQDEINAVLKKGMGVMTFMLIDKMAPQLGFTDANARQALKEGNINKAIELQMQSGDVRPINYQQIAKDLQQKLANRTILTRAFHQLAKDVVATDNSELEGLIMQYRFQK